MKRLVLALLLLPAMAQAQAFRLGKGLQLVPTATAPTKAAGNGEVYIDSGASNVLKYKNPAGTVITLGAAGAGTGYATIDDEGGALTQRTILNFIGSGVSCVDNAGATRTDCTISSGGSTLAASYSGGASQTDSTMLLDSTRLGVRIRDNATPITGALFSVQDSAGNAYLDAASTGTSIAQATKTSGTPSSVLLVSKPAHTGLTAGAELVAVDLSLGNTVQRATGAVTTQREVVIRAPQYSFVGASTITNAATLAITSSPFAGTNATLTNSWALWTQAGASLFQDGFVGSTVGYKGIVLDNYAAATVGAQKYSPALIWSGRGWQTTGPASETVQMLAQLVPVQGTAHPTVGLSIQSSINGGGWAESINIGSTGITASVPITANLGATTVAPTWTAITYSNSWVDFGASSTSRYSKNATGQVTLEIRCKNGSSATAAINSGTPIAAGYRPGQVVQICGQTLAGGIACGDLDTGGVFTPSVSSTSGIFLRTQYFAEN